MAWVCPLVCPLATQAATMAAIAAFWGIWGCGLIRTGKWCGGGFDESPIEEVVDVPVCVDDGVIPIGGEWVALIGDPFSPSR